MGKHFDSFESYSSALQTIVEHMYGMTRPSRPALEGRVPGTRWCGARFQCHRLTYDRHTGVQSALETGSPDNPLKVAHPVKARKLNGGSTSSQSPIGLALKTA